MHCTVLLWGKIWCACALHSISMVKISVVKSIVWPAQYLCGKNIMFPALYLFGENWICTKLYLCGKKLVCTAQYVCGGKFSLHCIVSLWWNFFVCIAWYLYGENLLFTAQYLCGKNSNTDSARLGSKLTEGSCVVEDGGYAAVGEHIL